MQNVNSFSVRKLKKNINSNVNSNINSAISGIQKLTRKQMCAALLFESGEYLDSEIADRLKMSNSSLSQIKARLKDKGYLRNLPNINSMPMVMPARFFRLHGLHFKAKPYYFYDGYKDNIGKSFYYDKWHIFINSENIEFQTKKHSSFDSTDIDQCVRDCRDSLEKAIINCHKRACCEIIRDDKLNIKLCNHHIAEVRNGIAVLIKTKKLEIEDEEGKVWAVVDVSTKEPEFETVDPIKATDDAHKLQRHLNSMRVEESPTVNDLGRCIKDTHSVLQETLKLIQVIPKNNVHLSPRLNEIKSREERINSDDAVTSLTSYDSELSSLSALKSRIIRSSDLHDCLQDESFCKSFSGLSQADKELFEQHLFDVSLKETMEYIEVRN